MPTRRRLHSYTQHDNTGEAYPLIGAEQQQQHHQQQPPFNAQQLPQPNLLFIGTGRTTAPGTSATAGATTPATYSGRSESSATAVFIDGNSEGNNRSYYDNDDNKYEKAAAQGGIAAGVVAGLGQWNFRALSSRLQATSGQALRTYIQQPLSAAAAVVVGNNTPHSYSNASNNNSANFYNSSAHGHDDGATEADGTGDSLLEPAECVLVMAARDRTGEFTNAIRSLQSRNITRAVNIRDPRRAKQVQSYAEFMMVAKHIGRNIASTYAKLEKLTMLARKKSLFDDRPQEIQELTYIIKGDLNALNQNIARLQDIAKEQRRSGSSGAAGGKHLASHSSNMVLALQSKLASMSTDFKQILEVRTENLKQQKTRRDQFSQGPPLAVSTVSPATAKQGSLLLSVENQSQSAVVRQSSAAATAVSIDMSASSAASETAPLLGGGGARGLQTQQQIALYDESDNYVQQRAETMQNIESTIVELGGIFQQLAHMVKEQEEIVERIDTNVQDAEINIEAAHGEILKYFQGVSKNRWLMIKIFGVLIFFFIFFVVFLT